MAKNILKSKGKKLTEDQKGFIERHYHRLDGYTYKYSNTFEGDRENIHSYLVEILLIAAVSYYENGIDKTDREEPGHLSGYVRGYMQSHIKKYKSKLHDCDKAIQEVSFREIDELVYNPHSEVFNMNFKHEVKWKRKNNEVTTEDN